MDNQSSFINRTITSIKRHGIRDFLRIIKLRVKHAVSVNPEFANAYELPNSELVLTREKNRFITVEESPVEATNHTLVADPEVVIGQKTNPVVSVVNEVLFPDDTIVIFAGVPYDDVGGGQRPAQFARVLLTQGKKVIYVYAYRKYDFALNAYVNSTIDIPNLVHIFLEDINPTELTEKLRSNTTVLFELPHKSFLPFAKHFWNLGITTVFDLIDEWDTSLGGDWYSHDIMQQFITNCTKVCGSAKLLRDKLVTMGRKDAMYVPNAANEQIFDLYRTFQTPPVVYTNQNRKRCLYFGSLYGEWFGWDYLITAAKKNPEVDFYLIGDYSNQKVLPGNILPIGAKNIEDLPAYLHFADVALLPFTPGKISDAVSPIKIFEYLFMGKPVVATHLPEIVDYPNVYVARDPEHYAELIKVALAGDESNKVKIESFISTNSWAFRLQQLISTEKKPLVSAIILIRNNEKIVRRCLQTLLANGSNYLKEIIVVDNKSSDNGPRIVESEFPEVKLLRNQKNGCSSGRNLGIKHATGEYIAFFDSDQWLTSEGSFEEAIRILDAYPFIGAVGWAAGWIDRNNENFGGMIMDYLPRRGMLENSYFRTDIGYLGTGGFFIKRDTLLKTNLFDEFYDPTAFEDTDLCFQLLHYGYKLAYRDLSGIKHQPHQTTNASAGSDGYTQLFKRNAEHFKQKWAEKRELFIDYKGF